MRLCILVVLSGPSLFSRSLKAHFRSLCTGSFRHKEVSGLFLALPFIIEIPAKVNGVDPDQMPRTLAYDLCLHWFPASFFMGC